MENNSTARVQLEPEDEGRSQSLEEVNVEQVLAKYDPESNYRRYDGLWKWIVSLIAITFSLFQLYTAIFGVLDAHIQRSIHLAFAMALVFILFPGRKAWPRNKMHPIDALLAVMATALPLYIVIFYQQLVYRSGMPTTTDMVVGVLGVLMVLEAARRVVGWPIVIVASAFLAYAFAGPNIPGAFAHRGVTLPSLAGHLYFTTEGIFGIPLGVSATFIFLFILFGAYLEKTGLGKFLLRLITMPLAFSFLLPDFPISRIIPGIDFQFPVIKLSYFGNSMIQEITIMRYDYGCSFISRQLGY
jgi:TRAP-type uncharacterized transport system fused permease subunit